MGPFTRLPMLLSLSRAAAPVLGHLSLAPRGLALAAPALSRNIATGHYASRVPSSSVSSQLAAKFARPGRTTPFSAASWSAALSPMSSSLLSRNNAHLTAGSTRLLSTTRLLFNSPDPANPAPKRSSIGDIFKQGTWSIVRLLLQATGTVVFVSGFSILLFFIYDATTYNVDGAQPGETLQIPYLALHPQKGGPKNLPIFDASLDDLDSPELREETTKPRLVILGTGWGTVALLKQIYARDYDVIVISPTNYFLFTPLLPSATVGTLETRSLIEPVRNILRRINAHFLQAEAVDILFDEQLVEVSAVNPSTKKRENFYVPYDKVVVGVGSVSNRHGVEGLEYCHQLKTIDDVAQIRSTVVHNIEAACLPTTTDEERKRLLSFVICGGGPTGVELAAELFDVVREDLARRYPKILRSEVSVHIVQSRSHILNTYDQSISQYAEQRFTKDGVDVITNSRVKRILPDRVEFTQVNEDGTQTLKELPHGMCIWSTGVDKAPLTRAVTERLGKEYQKNRRAIETDTHLRVLGAPLGTAYAIGDCSTVRTSIADEIEELLREGVLNTKRYFAPNGGSAGVTTDPLTVVDEAVPRPVCAKPVGTAAPPQDADVLTVDPSLGGGSTPLAIPSRHRVVHADQADIRDISLTFDDFLVLAHAIRGKYPQTAVHISRLEELFREYDTDASGTLSYAELQTMLAAIDRKITSLPATAQRAFQQGRYLGRKLHRVVALSEHLTVRDVKYGDVDASVYKPFVYRHLGSLAYIGNAAVFDMNGKGYFGGILAMYAWRAAYFAQTVSFRTRCLMFMDWLKRGLFGRDLSGV